MKIIFKAYSELAASWILPYRFTDSICRLEASQFQEPSIFRGRAVQYFDRLLLVGRSTNFSYPDAFSLSAIFFPIVCSGSIAGIWQPFLRLVLDSISFDLQILSNRNWALGSPRRFDALVTSITPLQPEVAFTSGSSRRGWWCWAGNVTRQCNGNLAASVTSL